MDFLQLQSLLTDKHVDWQVHNCKLVRHHIGCDQALPFWAQYDGLEEEVKRTIPLNKALLHRMNDRLTVRQSAQLLGIDEKLFKTTWHIKYIGRAVIFSPTLSLAVRFYFSNTAKTAQVMYVPTLQEALFLQSQKWQAFGVVDVLYKNSLPLVSVQNDVLTIDRLAIYQSLPDAHSLSIVAWMNADQDLPICQALHELITKDVCALGE